MTSLEWSQIVARLVVDKMIEVGAADIYSFREERTFSSVLTKSVISSSVL
jgi:hypothetical protein